MNNSHKNNSQREKPYSNKSHTRINKKLNPTNPKFDKFIAKIDKVLPKGYGYINYKIFNIVWVALLISCLIVNTILFIIYRTQFSLLLYLIIPLILIFLYIIVIIKLDSLGINFK